jgi:hypothetical protein
MVNNIVSTISKVVDVYLENQDGLNFRWMVQYLT